jgi:hypothetical protein
MKTDASEWWGSAAAQPDPGVDPDAWCQKGHPDVFRLPPVPPYTGQVPADAAPTRVKVLSYNLYWWKLFKTEHGNWGSAGKLIAASSVDEDFDLVAFQEWRILAGC